MEVKSLCVLANMWFELYSPFAECAKPALVTVRRRKKSQCSQVRPWRNATLFLCSQKWCRVNECRHSEIAPEWQPHACRRSQPAPRMDPRLCGVRLGVWLVPTPWMHRAQRVCGHRPGVAGRRAIPAPRGGFIWHSGGRSEEPFPGTRSCFLRSRPLLLVLPSSETGEFPSFIYIITLKVFIDCDWGPLSLLSLRLCKFSSRSPCSHILPSNSSLASLYFL